MSARIAAGIAAFIAVAVLAACGNLTEGKGLADRAIAEFHATFDDGRFDAIYDAAGDELKTAAPREKFTGLLAAVHRKLGKTTGSTGQGWKVNARNFRTFVQVVQDTAFEHGRGTETFTYVIDGGRAVLIGYHINSDDLILR